MADSYFGLILAFLGLVGIYYMLTYFAHLSPTKAVAGLENSITPATILEEYRTSKDKKNTMEKYKGKSLVFSCKFHSIKEAEEGLLEAVFLYGPELISCGIPTKKYPFMLKSNSASKFMFSGTVQKITNESIRMEEKKIEKL